MLCFLGVQVQRPLADRQKYRECLQEMRHYLTLRKAQVTDSDYTITVTNDRFTFSLPKHPLYLHSCFYHMPLFKTNDYDFLDTCYECLMIVQEAFPLSVQIELVSDAQSNELQAFEEGKQEEFSRRINNNLRTLTEATNQLTSQDVAIQSMQVENTIFLAQRHYTRKNKALALKFLSSKLTPTNAADLPTDIMECLSQLQEENELKRAAADLITRIRTIQADCDRNKENHMKASNLSQSGLGDMLQLQPLIFQLKESFNLERICLLLSRTLNTQHDKDFFSKMETAVGVVTARFLKDQFEQADRLGSELAELLKRFWTKRGKKWEESVRAAVDNKMQSYSLRRANTHKSAMTSRRDS